MREVVAVVLGDLERLVLDALIQVLEVKRRMVNTRQPFTRKGNSRLKLQTLSRSSGRSPPSLIPLFMEMNRSTVGLSFTFGLWRLVFNMMMAKDRM